jgi:hypothetical protein
MQIARSCERLSVADVTQAGSRRRFAASGFAAIVLAPPCVRSSDQYPALTYSTSYSSSNRCRESCVAMARRTAWSTRRQKGEARGAAAATGGGREGKRRGDCDKHRTHVRRCHVLPTSTLPRGPLGCCLRERTLARADNAKWEARGERVDRLFVPGDAVVRRARVAWNGWCVSLSCRPAGVAAVVVTVTRMVRSLARLPLLQLESGLSTEPMPSQQAHTHAEGEPAEGHKEERQVYIQLAVLHPNLCSNCSSELSLGSCMGRSTVGSAEAVVCSFSALLCLLVWYGCCCCVGGKVLM